jgi:hypothetical protein
VLGIIKTMGAISQPPEYLGKLIGSALVGTFLGVFLAYGFVGPIETASTLTVLQFFPVLKPSLRHRSFLSIEHAHPSFLPYLSQFPHRAAGGPSPAAP